MLLIKSRLLSNRRLLRVLGWSLIYIGITSAGLHNYIHITSPLFLLGVICLFQVSLQGGSEETSLRFAYITMAFCVLSIFIPFKTILYLTSSAALLFLLENNYGKVRYAALYTIIIMSPVFQYAVDVFSFPIRLQLTKWAGSLLIFTGQKILSEGNTLIINGNEFTVDPECMGLNMMETSLLLGIMISCFYQDQFKARLSFLSLFLILLMISALNIISNLFRIIAIVQFNIQPVTIMHDITGLACLVLYVVVPGTFLIKLILKNSGKQMQPRRRFFGGLAKTGSVSLYLLVMAGIIVTAFNTYNHDRGKHSFIMPPPAMRGYVVERIDADIIKLTDPASLVYIKSIPGFYSTEHNPMICWKGSGYTFRKVEIIEVRGHSVYSAILTKGEAQLYTAWWYDNSKKQTISQLSWRWDVFKGGANYSLINITCSSYRNLRSKIQDISETRRFNSLL